MSIEIDRQIYLIRGEKVMLDSDLAALYGVSTKALNQAVKRNLKRFPSDFMFQISFEEAKELFSSRSQYVTLKPGQNIKYAPYVFTEHGAVMLASVLNSSIAIEASVNVVRAFMRLRSILAVHKELARQLDNLDRKFTKEIKNVYKLIDQYLRPPVLPKSKIGFRVSKNKLIETKGRRSNLKKQPPVGRLF